MAFCPPEANDSGYATPAALLLSLALALAGAGIMAQGVEAMKLARMDLELTRQSYALDGAQLVAAASVIRSGVEGPYRWNISTDAGWIEVIAEPESDKISYEAAAALDDAIFQGLGINDIEALRTQLSAAAASTADSKPSLIDMEFAPLWRRCAPAFISPAGKKSEVQIVPYKEPGPGPNPPAWHIGEVWRIRVATETGWRDDRIVRFTGDARHPAATVERKFLKGDRVGGGCERLLTELFGG